MNEKVGDVFMISAFLVWDYKYKFYSRKIQEVKAPSSQTCKMLHTL